MKADGDRGGVPGQHELVVKRGTLRRCLIAEGLWLVVASRGRSIDGVSGGLLLTARRPDADGAATLG